LGVPSHRALPRGTASRTRATGNTLVIYLTATATQPVKVAWMVLG